jgi:toxin ParE1/3/4
MSGQLRWSRQAYEDYESIAVYVGEVQGCKSVAVKLMKDLLTRCELYAANSELGQRCPEVFPDARLFRYKRYVIVYRPIASGIELIRIVDGARDFPSLGIAPPN